MGLTDRNNPQSFEEMAANEAKAEEVQTESTETTESTDEEVKEEPSE